MSKNEIKENKKIEDLTNAWEKLLKDQAIISAAIQYKKSQETINQKIENENAAISYGIKAINKKVIENMTKYTEVDNELKTLLDQYKNNLDELSQYHDTQIVMGYAKIYEEELKQCRMYKEIFYLQEEETNAKKKVDNSDDEIREKICDIEDEISKSDLKIRRLRPTLRKKIITKEQELMSAMESEEKEVQKETIKGPRIFNKATKFFLGKINPTKIIQKNVFNGLKNRIEKFNEMASEKSIKKSNEKYKEENIVETINKITEE